MSNPIRFWFRAMGVCLTTLALAACTTESPTAPEALGLEAAKSRNAPGTGSYSLTVTVLGTGSVSTNDVQMNCSANCSTTYPSGSTVTLTAAPAAGSVLLGWSGACSGTANTCTVTITSNTTVAATFGPAPSPAHASIPSAYRSWRIRDWSVDIDVAAHAADPVVLPGAVVTVQLSGGLTGTRTCTTGVDGACRIASGWISNKATSITFTITNVSLSGFAYDPMLNHNLNPAGLGVTSTNVVVTSNNAVTFLK